MRDNAGENRSQEIEEYIQSKDVQSRYSTAYEQWQDGQPETAIRTLTRLVRSMKTESGMNVQFWFHMLVAAANASNVTFKRRLNSTPHKVAFGEKKDLTKLRTFGCKAVMYLEDARRDGPGRFADRGAEGINLGLAIDQNTSGYKIYLPKEKVIRVTNQVTFDESYFPMKEAATARLPRTVDPVFETEDAFPPEEGNYLVSYDFHLLDPGFSVERFDSSTMTYTCIPRDFPRCRIVTTEAQYQELIDAMTERARTQVMRTAPTIIPPLPPPPPLHTA